MKKIVVLLILLTVSTTSMSFSFINDKKTIILKKFLFNTSFIYQKLSLRGMIVVNQGNIACNQKKCTLTIHDAGKIHYHTVLPTQGEKQVTGLLPETFVKNWQENYCLPKNKVIEAYLAPLSQKDATPVLKATYLSISNPSYDKKEKTLSFDVSNYTNKPSNGFKNQILVFTQDCF